LFTVDLLTTGRSEVTLLSLEAGYLIMRARPCRRLRAGARSGLTRRPTRGRCRRSAGGVGNYWSPLPSRRCRLDQAISRALDALLFVKRRCGPG
jgi:hypothetical protein